MAIGSCKAAAIATAAAAGKGSSGAGNKMARAASRRLVETHADGKSTLQKSYQDSLATLEEQILVQKLQVIY